MRMSDTVELLKQVPLLRTLPEADLVRLADSTRHVSYRPDQVVVEMGDAGHSLYVILEGGVQVVYPGRTSEFELARLGPGDFFGEMALLNEKPRSATVRALDGVEALVLEKDSFRRAVEERPALAVRLLEALSERMRHTDAHISDLSEDALRDPLTGLLNRRSFHDRVTREIGRVLRYHGVFSLVLLELDAFGGLADTVGQDTANEVLRWIGRLLLEHTRTADCPFRVGPEEFAVLCPDSGSEAAGQAARRLIDLVAAARPPVEGLSLTMSAGHATCPDHGARFEALYRGADEALARAHEAGTSRVQAAVAALPDEDE